jgi:hypothetical protein
MIRRRRSLTSSPTNNTHKYSLINRLSFVVYYTVYIHVKILSMFT